MSECLSNAHSKKASRGRPRTASDAQILAAAGAIVVADGPAALTFARLAAEAGLAPATLMHRFGGRDALIRALSASITDQMTALCRKTAAASGADLTGFLGTLVSTGDTPASVSNRLAFLQLELADPELRAGVQRRSRAVRSAIGRLLRAGRPAHTPDAVPPERLARLLEQQLVGSQICWSMEPRGGLRSRVLRDARLILERSGWSTS